MAFLQRRRAWQEYIMVVLIMAAIYAVFILVVSPRQVFPRDDDWSYNRTVQNLLKTGQLKISDWDTFMSDVFYLGLMIMSLAFYVRG